TPCETRTRSASRFVDLLEFALRPLDGLFGRHALYCLSVHVRDDVLADPFLGLGIRRTGKAWRLAEAGSDLEWRHYRINVPELVRFPLGCTRCGEALLREKPLLVVCLGMDPLQEILCGFLILRILHQHVRVQRMEAELSRRPTWQGRMLDI